VAIAAAAICILTSRAAQAKPPQALCVDPADSACSATIQGAIDLITARQATIAVAAGTYTENVSINTGTKPKKLTVTITGAATTIVDGNSAGSVFTIGAKATVTLDDLTIEQGTGQPITSGSSAMTGGGIFLNGGTLIVQNCIVTMNQADLGAGVSVIDGALTITGSTITNNAAISTTASDGGGIYFSGTKGRKLTITQSTIDANSAAFGGGVILLTSSSGTGLKLSGNISDSTVSNNTANSEGGGLMVQQAKLTLTNSTVSGNSASDSAAQGGGLLTFLPA
jgi:hypothetical protein